MKFPWNSLNFYSEQIVGHGGIEFLEIVYAKHLVFSNVITCLSHSTSGAKETYSARGGKLLTRINLFFNVLVIYPVIKLN